jgi:hypothetical protein
MIAITPTVRPPALLASDHLLLIPLHALQRAAAGRWSGGEGNHHIQFCHRFRLENRSRLVADGPVADTTQRCSTRITREGYG